MSEKPHVVVDLSKCVVGASDSLLVEMIGHFPQVFNLRRQLCLVRGLLEKSFQRFAWCGLADGYYAVGTFLRVALILYQHSTCPRTLSVATYRSRLQFCKAFDF